MPASTAIGRTVRHVTAVDADFVREDHFAHEVVLEKFESGFDFAFEFRSSGRIGFFRFFGDDRSDGGLLGFVDHVVALALVFGAKSFFESRFRVLLDEAFHVGGDASGFEFALRFAGELHELFDDRDDFFDFVVTDDDRFEDIPFRELRERRLRPS